MPLSSLPTYNIRTCAEILLFRIIRALSNLRRRHEPRSCPSTKMSESTLAALTATVAALEGSVAKNTEILSTLPGSVDTFYFITVGALVFFMQAGFGLLEAGSVRTKNTKNILLKNLLDACIGAIVWWAWGFAAAVKLP